MGALAMVEFLTLDGVMQGFHGPDEEGGFRHSGWGASYQHESMFAAGVEGQAATKAYLLGRRTYEELARFWPHQPDDNPMAAHLNRTPKYVVTNTLEELTWPNAHRLEGDLAPAVEQLKGDTGGDVVVLGSGRLAEQLFAADLVDRLRLFVHPLVLGSGRQLFPRMERPLRLRLQGATTTPTGVLMLSYERVPA